jgi:hypothetical protein
MADRKISDLTALTTPASGDFLPIVDISEAAAASKNKRITIEELMRGVPDGTAAAPGIAFETDPNTGIYRPGADQLAVATNGAGRLFVDANGNVGINNPSPAYYLDVTGHIRFGSPNQFFTELNALSGVVGQNGAYIRSAVSVATNPTYSNADDQNTGIFFPAADTLAASTGGSERLRITSAGLVGIGTSSPSGRLHVIADAITTGAGLQTWGYDVNQPNYQLRLRTDVSAGIVKYNFNLLNQSIEYDANLVLDRGRVGIGSSTPQSPFVVSNGGANGIEIRPVESDIIAYNRSGAAWGDLKLNSANNIFQIQGAERARIDNSGRLLVGTSSARDNFFGSASGQATQFQVEGTDYKNSGASFTTNNASLAGFGPHVIFARSRGASVGSNTIVQNGDTLGILGYLGNDGAKFVDAARISCEVDGTPGTNDMPARLVFSTTADGASSPTTRLTIASNGDFRVANTGFFHPVTDNAVSLGLSGFRWSAVWAANGTIQTSDERAKADITNATLGSDFIKALRPVSYKWIEGGKRDTGERDEDNNYIYESVSGTRTHWGFIAQEVKQVVDAAGVDFGGWVLTDKDDPDSQQALRYDQFIAPLTKALQEALAEIDVLKAKVAALETP